MSFGMTPVFGDNYHGRYVLLHLIITLSQNALPHPKRY
jgi:hypothetical protein